MDVWTRRWDTANRGAACSTAPFSLLLVVSTLVLLTVLRAGPLRAQVPDSTQGPDSTQAAPPDSMMQAGQRTAAASDTLAAPLPMLSTLRGTPVLDRPPVQHPAPELVRLLPAVPGSFLFDLGANGWPHGWSWNGLAPQHTTLVFDGHPYDDPVTGRPRFDLLPPAFLQAPRVGPSHHGGPVGVYTQPRRYDVDRPLTELRYRRDNTSMQSVGVAHVQQRSVTPFGVPSLLHIVAGYYGRAADNEYPNSDLRRERRLLGQVRLRGSSWSLTLRNLHSRRRMGTHGGVQPQGGVFETIYNRAIALVRRDRARRQTIRNDLALTARVPLLPGLSEPLTVSTNWTAQTFRFRDADTLLAKTNRLSGYVRQDATWRAHTLQAEIGGTLDQQRETNAWAGLRTRQRLHAALRDSIAWGATTVILDGSAHATDDHTYPSAAVRIDHRWRAFRLFADARLAGQPVSWVEAAGFGETLQPLDAVPMSQVRYAQLGAAAAIGPVDVRLAGFAHTTTKAIDLYATAEEDVLATRASDTPFRRAGATLELGWRQETEAGLYAEAQATAVQFLNSDGPLAARVAETLPRTFGQGRLGARFVAFEGDLNADLFVTGRAWTRFRSRHLHPPTGLLAVPLPDTPALDNAPLHFGPSGTMDVTLEAGIREATLFFTMENLLSGTQLQPGILMVPVYPLPERRFRFGVFWPIWN